MPQSILSMLWNLQPKNSTAENVNQVKTTSQEHYDTSKMVNCWGVNEYNLFKISNKMTTSVKKEICGTQNSAFVVSMLTTPLFTDTI